MYIYAYHRYNHIYIRRENKFVSGSSSTNSKNAPRMHIVVIGRGLCRFIYWQCLQLSIMKKWLHNYNLMRAFGSVWPLAASIFIGKFRKCPFNFFICQLKWWPSRIIILPYDRHYRYYNGIYGTIVNI